MGPLERKQREAGQTGAEGGCRHQPRPGQEGPEDWLPKPRREWVGVWTVVPVEGRRHLVSSALGPCFELQRQGQTGSGKTVEPQDGAAQGWTGVPPHTP